LKSSRGRKGADGRGQGSREEPEAYLKPGRDRREKCREEHGSETVSEEPKKGRKVYSEGGLLSKIARNHGALALKSSKEGPLKTDDLREKRRQRWPETPQGFAARREKKTL